MNKIRKYWLAFLAILLVVVFAVYGQYQVVGPVRLTKLVEDTVTLGADDATPDVRTGVRFITQANIAPTEITDLDNPVVDQIIVIVGGSGVNSTTITDGGNFNLNGNWTANVDSCLVLYVQADNDYVELNRSDVMITDAALVAIAALAVSDGNFIVGNGATWIIENGNIARTSLGLGTGDSPTFNGASFNDANITNIGSIALDTIIGDDGSTVKVQSAGDSTTGFQVLDANGGTPILNIDTTNERVAIGGTAPLYKLDVVGDLRVTDTGGVRLTSGGTNWTSVDIRPAESDSVKIFINYGGASGDQNLILGTYANRVDQLVLHTDGNVNVANTLAATTVTGANVTSGADPGHTHTGGSLGSIDISDDTNLAGGDALTLNDDTIDFDGGAAPAGDLGGTWGTPSVDNDSHDHTGATLSGVDISDDTNLVAGGGLTLTDDTLAVGAGDGVIVNADEIEVYGLVASDGSPNNTVATVDADGDIAFGLAFASMEITSQYQYEIQAIKNILIDGRTNPRNMTLGLIRILHTPSIPDTSALFFDVEANGHGDTHGIFLVLHADDMIAGDDIMGLEVSLDKSNSTGGAMEGLRVSTGGVGSAEAHALHADPGVVPIHHESGDFGNIEQAWDQNGGFTDVTAAFNDPNTDVTIFSANADMVHIGDAADFNAIQVNLATFASGAGVKPSFAYSIAGPLWTPFTPESDGTNGFRSSGTIAWDETVFVAWAAVNVNGATKKYIRITRTQVGLGTSPIEDTIQVLESIEYHWDENGDVSVNSLGVSDSSIITGEEKHIKFTLADPNGLQGNDDEWGIELNVADAITITRVEVSTNTAAQELTGDLVYVDTLIGLANPIIINDFNTTSGVRDDSTITVGAVPAGKSIIVDFDGDSPHADILWAVFKITYTID